MPEIMINDTIVTILYKLLKEQPLLPQEQILLDKWLSGSGHKNQLLDELKDEGELFEELKKRYAFDSSNEWAKMLSKLRQDPASSVTTADLPSEDLRPAVHRVHFLKTSWFRYAAAVVLIAGAAAVWYKILNRVQHDGKGSVVQDDGRGGDIAPGSEKAVLTLADGTKIILDNAANGNVAQQGGTKIIKLDNGQLAYDAAGRHPELVSGSVLYNTISTPRGGQYQITLPDGSKVWLNAASSIKFPTAFTGKTREVEMTGEAYLEIAKNSKQPFRVKANGTEIQVLGTSFNINAYSDEEAVKTTLIEGGIKVVTNTGYGQRSTILKPGEQCSFVFGQSPAVNNADISEVLAWKNGIFNFNNADIKAMMRQLCRWYNVDVQYEGQIPDRVFEGKMQRDIPLSSALKILELNKINFRVEGRKIIVLP